MIPVILPEAEIEVRISAYSMLDNDNETITLALTVCVFIDLYESGTHIYKPVSLLAFAMHPFVDQYHCLPSWYMYLLTCIPGCIRTTVITCICLSVSLFNRMAYSFIFNCWLFVLTEFQLLINKS